MIITRDVIINEKEFPCLKTEVGNSSNKVQEENKVKVILSSIGNRIEVEQKRLETKIEEEYRIPSEIEQLYSLPKVRKKKRKIELNQKIKDLIFKIISLVEIKF